MTGTSEITLDVPDAATIAIDDGGVIRAASPRLCAITGYEASDLVGQALASFQLQPQESSLPQATLRARDGSSIRLALERVETVDHRRLRIMVAERSPGDAVVSLVELNRALFEANPQPMWIYDRETLRFLAVNDAAISRYGHSREEFLTLRIDEIRPEHEKERLYHRLVNMDSGVLNSGPWTHLTRSGESFQVEITSHDLRFADRDARIVAASDVTDRERAREALQKSEQQHRALVEVSPDLILIARHGRIVFANEAGARIVGARSRDDLIGRELLTFFSPDSRSALSERLPAIAAEERALPLTEESLVRDDGSLLRIELIAIPFAYHGEPSALIIARDISERQAAATRLGHSHALLRSTLDSTADGIIVLDRHGRILSYNQRLLSMWGVRADTPEEELIEVLSTRAMLRDRFTLRFTEQLADMQLESREDVTLADGKVLDAHSLPFQVDGTVLGRVWSFRDVTDQRRSIVALRRRDAILQAVAFASERLLVSADWRVCLHEVISRLGRAAAVDRCYVSQLVEKSDDTYSRWLEEWAGPGITNETELHGNRELPMSLLGNVLERLRRNDATIMVPDRVETPFRQEMIDQQARSALLVPIALSDTLWGFIGFDDCHVARAWSTYEIDALRAAARALGAAIQRSVTEDALRRSEERFRLLFERNLAGVFRNSLDGTVLDCNEACARILGFPSRDDLLTRPAHDSYFANEQRELLIEQLHKTGSLSNVELCLKRADGRAVWVLENVTLLKDDQGEPVLEGTIVDITDRKRAEEALRQSEERYRLMAENSTDMISRQTPEGVYVYCSPASRLLLGVNPADLTGRLVESLIHPDDREEYLRRQRIVQETESVQTMRCRMRRADDTYIWVETTSRLLVDQHATSSDEIISVSRDITERKRAEELIEYQAYHDPLTGLPNRIMFTDRVTLALNRARRLQRKVAVMFLDLDNFKVVNDTHGHTVGDQLLRDVAARLRSCVREEDTLARLGGDEFVLLIFELDDPAVAEHVAAKILSAFDRPFLRGSVEFKISTSIGIALHPADGDSCDALLRAADQAMYRAKKAGRNNIQIGG